MRPHLYPLHKLYLPIVDQFLGLKAIVTSLYPLKFFFHFYHVAYELVTHVHQKIDAPIVVYIKSQYVFHD